MCVYIYIYIEREREENNSPQYFASSMVVHFNVEIRVRDSLQALVPHSSLR